ncbi:hypothetical protein BDV06DRAFT_126831 [Aspergillus oleicola]
MTLPLLSELLIPSLSAEAIPHLRHPGPHRTQQIHLIQHNEPHLIHGTPPPTIPICSSALPAQLTFSEDDLKLEHYVTSASITPDLRTAFSKFRATAVQAISVFGLVNKHRQSRFLNLCPRENPYRFARHSNAINHLIAWKRDYRPADPTLAPSLKIPHVAMEGLCVSRETYVS